MRIQLLVAASLMAAPALAHQTLHEVRHGKAVAVRAYQSDGDPLAGTAFEVYAPGEPKTPWSTGRTDRDGWLAFVPGASGRWRVRVIEASGHGLDVDVEVTPPAAALASTSAASPPADRPQAGSGAAVAVRPLLGLGIIGLVFTALFLAWRKKGRSPPP